MAPRERFLTALARRQPDRVPLWELIVNEPVVRALHGPGVSYFDFCEREGLDGVTVGEDQRFEEVEPGVVRDEWGIVWRRCEGGIPYRIDGPIHGPGDVDGYRAPDPDADHRLATLEEAVARFGGERAIVFLSHEAFEFSHYLYGMEDLFVAYLAEPEVPERLARVVTDYKKRVAERAVGVGADVVLTGDDYANRKGPLMSPRHFRRFCLPYLREMVELAHRLGRPFIKHTDGNVWELVDGLVACGIDGLDPLEPIAGMDIGEVKARYGGRVAVCGNVDCGELLSRGTPDQVVEAVKETIAKGSPGGGHILASSNSIHPAVRPENYRAMLKAAREFGHYPLDARLVEEYRAKQYVAAYVGKGASV